MDEYNQTKMLFHVQERVKIYSQQNQDLQTDSPWMS